MQSGVFLKLYMIKNKIISEKEKNDISVSNMTLYSYTDESLWATIDYVH